MGDLLGHGIRFGMADDVLAAGEGIETVLSPRMVLPGMPMIAATSAAHLAAILFPATLRRLYVLRDRDPAGNRARDRLVERATSAGIEAVVLSPRLEDFNEDLRLHGSEALRALIRPQLVHEDATRFMAVAAQQIGDGGGGSTAVPGSLPRGLHRSSAGTATRPS